MAHESVTLFFERAHLPVQICVQSIFQTGKFPGGLLIVVAPFFQVPRSETIIPHYFESRAPCYGVYQVFDTPAQSIDARMHTWHVAKYFRTDRPE